MPKSLPPRPRPTRPTAPPVFPERDLLTRPETAAYLNIGMRTLDRWIAEGILPAIKIGPRQVRIDAADVRALMRRMKAAS